MKRIELYLLFEEDLKMKTFDLARAVAEHIGAEKISARELFDKKIGAAEQYFRERGIQQPTNRIGDVLEQYAKELGITVFKRKPAQYNLKQGDVIIVDSTLPARGRAFSKAR